MIKQTLPTVDELTRLIEDATSSDCHPSVIRRLSILRYFVLYRPTVLELCRHFGISRSTFHRWIERFDPTDPLSLQDRSHDELKDRPVTVSTEAVELIRRYRHDAPLLGKERIASLLRQQHGITVSASTVGRVIDRECLFFGETPLHWKKRIEHGSEDWTLPEQPSMERPSIASPSDSGMQIEQRPFFPHEESCTGSAPHEESCTGSAVVPAEVVATRAPFSGFMKAVIMASLLINIVFISMLFGMALFERSLRFAVTDPSLIESTQGLHGASPTAIYPQ